MVGRYARLLFTCALVCGGACSRQMTEAEAKQRAIGFALGELSIASPANQKIDVVEKSNGYEVTYSPTSKTALGGPVVVAVNKRTGEPKLLAPKNEPL